jgi:hypothetical protein
LLHAKAAEAARVDVNISLQQQQQWLEDELHWGEPLLWQEARGAAAQLPQQQPMSKIQRLLPPELLQLQLPVSQDTLRPQQQKQQQHAQGLSEHAHGGSSRAMAPFAMGLSSAASDLGSPGALPATSGKCGAAAAANSSSCPGDHLVQQRQGQDVAAGLFTARSCGHDGSKSTASPSPAAAAVAAAAAEATAKVTPGSSAASPAQGGVSQRQRQVAGPRSAGGAWCFLGPDSATAASTAPKPTCRMGQSVLKVAGKNSGQSGGAARLTPAIVQRTTLQ